MLFRSHVGLFLGQDGLAVGDVQVLQRPIGVAPGDVAHLQVLDAQVARQLLGSRDNDLVVNPIKGKQLTNVRASGTDEAVALVPAIQLSLESAIEFIDDDELVEITPKNIRIRKRFLLEHERKKASREAA